MKRRNARLTILGAVLGLSLAGQGAFSQTAPPAAAGSNDNAEATAKLQALLRIDTTNPPGNEADAARLIADWLKAEGIGSELYESAPGRLNLVARLKGSGEVQPLLLLNHLDVVMAEPARWRQAPFAGNIVDDTLWGRGTLDMKGLGIMELMAFIALKRQGGPLKRDVIFCAVADEESGGEYGAEWMLKHHPEAVACSEVLNEGGAGMTMANGATVMAIQTAERGNLWVKVTASGKPGHGSQERPDGASRKLIRALAKLETVPRKYELIPQAFSLLKAIATTETGIRQFVLSHLDNPWLLDMMAPTLIKTQPQLAPMLGMTVNTTVLKAGSKVNVIPSEASAEIDIRMLPGYTIEQTLDYLKKTLADPDLTYTILDAKVGGTSPADGELFRTLGEASRAEYPGIVVSEMLTPGGMTDSSFFRARGIRAYGLMPIIASADQLASMHGDNENITLAQLAKGTRVTISAVAAAARKAP
ncbi:MAG: M20/M25/M40 family metallo-hydrolase [Candidatus Sericytochromatia bacterium]|nr:M20/M25/M40 family metallo-hydrolase [Candidatus Sericytochromatia bacterium]